MLACCRSRELVLRKWDVPSTAKSSSRVTSACITSKFILTASLNDNFIRFWDSSTFTLMEKIAIGDVECYVVDAISPDERRVAAVNTKNSISLWNVSTRQLICPPVESFMQSSHSSISLFFLPDSSRLVVSCIRGTASTWSAHDGSLISCTPASNDLNDHGSHTSTSQMDGYPHRMRTETSRLKKCVGLRSQTPTVGCGHLWTGSLSGAIVSALSIVTIPS